MWSAGQWNYYTLHRLRGFASTREVFSRCVSEPLAIISITLDGMSDAGSPKVVYETLVPHLKTNVCYINIDFSLAHVGGAVSYAEWANTLVDLFETGCLRG